MKKTLLLSAFSLSALVILSGCSSSTGQIIDVNSYKGKNRCTDLNKDLIKVDQYIEVVSQTDAFHLEEAAQAIEKPNISTSTNKPRMLKDANSLRDSLMMKKKKLGCPDVKTKQ
ncbi:MAG: hypothetical protein U9Q90_04285 [Campylobacterota bacterium]|nr:hypothetical protein [Campylobacterota bacterium]